MSRKYTNKILEMMDAGVISPTWLAEALAVWCSEQSMMEFYERNCMGTYDPDLEDNDEEEDEDE